MKRLRSTTLALALAGVATAQGEAVYERGPCPFDGAEGVEGLECGTLTVRERRGLRGGRTLRLAVAVLRSTGADPAPDPLVFLSGGPGGRSVEGTPGRTRSAFWSRLRERRDLIFFDQRGTGLSEPRFCPELDTAVAVAPYRNLTASELEAEWVATARTCRAEMEAAGVDLTAYTSAASARDLDDLRRALGYASWNLLGVSYGTRLALEALREAPAGIRAVILDSVLPPDAPHWANAGERYARTLELAFARCAADLACSAAYPTLEEDFYAVIAELEANPLELPVGRSSISPDGRMILDGTLWARGMFQGFYDPAFAPVFPLVVRESRRRNTTALAALAERIAPDIGAIRAGMHYAVVCFEQAPLTSRAALEADRARHPGLDAWFDVGYRADLEVCRVWHDARADSATLAPVRSSVPALVLAGDYDPITPPSYGRHAAQTLPNATFVEVAGQGHGPSPFTACTRGLIDAFLAEPTRPPDTSCATAVTPAPFATDVHVNAGVYRFASALRGGAGPLAALSLLGLLLLSAVVGWPAAALVARRRRRAARAAARGAAVAARLAAGVAALSTLLFVGGLAFVIVRVAASNPYLLALGVPDEAAWLFAVPWAIAASTLVALALAVPAFRQNWWTAAGRLHYVAVALACLGVIAFAARWGLIA